MTGVALNSVTIGLPRNGTTAHTLDPTNATGGGAVIAGSAFTPTSGRLLVAFVEGAVTSTTPSGWTLPGGGSAINFSGLYVFTKTAASGSNAASTTHNASNYPVVVTFLEYAAGSTFDQVVAATPSTKTAASGGLTGMTGTKTVIGVVANDYDATTGTSATTWTASSGSPVKDFDLTAVRSGTDGYAFSLAYIDGFTGATWTPTGSMVNSSAVTAKECLTVALTVASSGTPATVTGDPPAAVGKVPAGTPTAGATFGGPPAPAVGAVPAGVAAAGASTAGVALLALGAVPAGSVTAAATVIGVPIAASFPLLAGIPTAGATITGDPAAGSGAVPGGSTTAGATVVGSAAPALGTVPPGVASAAGAATVVGAPIAALGMFPAGIASGGGAATVVGVPIMATLTFTAGVITAGATVTGASARSTATVPSGIGTAGALVTGTPARAVGTVTAGSVTAGATILGAPARTISTVPPGVAIGAGPGVVVGVPVRGLGVFPAGVVVVGPIVHIPVPSDPVLIVIGRRTLSATTDRRTLAPVGRRTLTEPKEH